MELLDKSGNSKCISATPNRINACAVFDWDVPCTTVAEAARVCHHTTSYCLLAEHHMMSLTESTLVSQLTSTSADLVTRRGVRIYGECGGGESCGGDVTVCHYYARAGLDLSCLVAVRFTG